MLNEQKSKMRKLVRIDKQKIANAIKVHISGVFFSDFGQSFNVINVRVMFFDRIQLQILLKLPKRTSFVIKSRYTLIKVSKK